eukprot:gene7029-4985_t
MTIQSTPMRLAGMWVRSIVLHEGSKGGVAGTSRFTIRPRRANRPQGQKEAPRRPGVYNPSAPPTPPPTPPQYEPHRTASTARGPAPPQTPKPERPSAAAGPPPTDDASTDPPTVRCIVGTAVAAARHGLCAWCRPSKTLSERLAGALVGHRIFLPRTPIQPEPESCSSAQARPPPTAAPVALSSAAGEGSGPQTPPRFDRRYAQHFATAEALLLPPLLAVTASHYVAGYCRSPSRFADVLPQLLAQLKETVTWQGVCLHYVQHEPLPLADTALLSACARAEAEGDHRVRAWLRAAVLRAGLLTLQVASFPLWLCLAVMVPQLVHATLAHSCNTLGKKYAALLDVPRTCSTPASSASVSPSQAATAAGPATAPAEADLMGPLLRERVRACRDGYSAHAQFAELPADILAAAVAFNLLLYMERERQRGRRRMQSSLHISLVCVFPTNISTIATLFLYLCGSRTFPSAAEHRLNVTKNKKTNTSTAAGSAACVIKDLSPTGVIHQKEKEGGQQHDFLCRCLHCYHVTSFTRNAALHHRLVHYMKGPRPRNGLTPPQHSHCHRGGIAGGEAEDPCLFLCSDPPDARLGSGAGTVHALWQYFSSRLYKVEAPQATNNLSDEEPASTAHTVSSAALHSSSACIPASRVKQFKAWLTSGTDTATTSPSELLMILHAGGSSRRLPGYSALGKMLVPVPTPSVAPDVEPNKLGPLGDSSVLLEHQFAFARRIAQALPRSHPYRVVVLCGDVLLRCAPSSPVEGEDWLAAAVRAAAAPAIAEDAPSVDAPLPDVLCLGLEVQAPATQSTTPPGTPFPEVLHKHGVFVVPPTEGVCGSPGGGWMAVLQKPTAAALFDWRWRVVTAESSTPRAGETETSRRGNDLLLDVGVWLLSGPAVEQLMEQSMLPCDAEEDGVRHTTSPPATAGGPVAYRWRPMDLFSDFLPPQRVLPLFPPPLGSNVAGTPSHIMNSSGLEATEAEAMKHPAGVPRVGLCRLPHALCEFYHVGTTVDLLDSLARLEVAPLSSPSLSTVREPSVSLPSPNAAKDDAGAVAHKGADPVQGKTRALLPQKGDGTGCWSVNSVVLLPHTNRVESMQTSTNELTERTHASLPLCHSDVCAWLRHQQQQIELPSPRCILLHHCALSDALHLTHHHVLTNIPRNRWSITLPPYTCVEVLPVQLCPTHLSSAKQPPSRTQRNGKRRTTNTCRTGATFTDEAEGLLSFDVLRPYHCRDAFPQRVHSCCLAASSLLTTPFLHAETVALWLAQRGMRLEDLVTAVPQCEGQAMDMMDVPFFPCVPRRGRTPSHGARSSFVEAEASIDLMGDLLAFMVLSPPPGALQSASAPPLTPPSRASLAAAAAVDHPHRSVEDWWGACRNAYLAAPRLSARDIQDCVDVDEVVRRARDIQSWSFATIIRDRLAQPAQGGLLGSLEEDGLYETEIPPASEQRTVGEKMTSAPTDLDAIARTWVDRQLPLSALCEPMEGLLGPPAPGDFLPTSTVTQQLLQQQQRKGRRAMAANMLLARAMRYMREALQESPTVWCQRRKDLDHAMQAFAAMGKTLYSKGAPCAHPLDTTPARHEDSRAGEERYASLTRRRDEVATALLRYEGLFRAFAFDHLRRVLIIAYLPNVVVPPPCGGHRPCSSGGCTAHTVTVRSPVRVDLCGGWTDTPPYGTFASGGGRVVNMAVNLDGAPPVTVRVYPLQQGGEAGCPGRQQGIRVRSLDMQHTTWFDSPAALEVLVTSADRAAHPASIAAMALALLGFMPSTSSPEVQGNAAAAALAQEIRHAACPSRWALGVEGREWRCGGIAIDTEVKVPAGSGLGTSSILAAAVLAALHDYTEVHSNTDGENHYSEPAPLSLETVHRLGTQVLLLEQLLGTGGGWQDAHGGMLPGLKLLCGDASFSPVLPSDKPPCAGSHTRSSRWEAAASFPAVRSLPVPVGVDTPGGRLLFSHPLLSACHILYFTGLTRAAREILREIVEDMFLQAGATMRLLGRMRLLALEMHELLASPPHAAASIVDLCVCGVLIHTWLLCVFCWYPGGTGARRTFFALPLFKSTEIVVVLCRLVFRSHVHPFVHPLADLLFAMGPQQQQQPHKQERKRQRSQQFSTVRPSALKGGGTIPASYAATTNAQQLRNIHSEREGGAAAALSSSSATPGAAAFDPIRNDPVLVVVEKSSYWPPPTLEELQQRTGIKLGSGNDDGFDLYDRREEEAEARKEKQLLAAHKRKGELQHPRGRPPRNTVEKLDSSSSSSDSE